MARTSRSGIAVILCALLVSASFALAEGIGWRTDATGRYPDATPPTEWSLETNVVWSTEMPARSNSTPVIVGDRVFTCSNPSTLMCLSVSDGTVLWQAPHEYTDVAEPDELAGMVQKQAEYDDLRGQIRQTAAQRRRLVKQLQDDPDNAALKTQVQELREKLGGLNQQIKPYLDTWFVCPPMYQYTGYTTPTPVTDGEHVWALFGNGIACCYDLEGNRVWAEPVGKPRSGYGHSASPVLAGDNVIMHVTSMKALDRLTGELAWEASLPCHWGTAVVVEIEDTPVIITPKGDAVNAIDGAVLARKLGNANYCQPLIEDGVVYFLTDGLWRAVKLPETLDPFEVEQLWELQPQKERYYGSPVIHEGIIYAVTRHQLLSAVDAATGEVFYEQALSLAGSKYQCYPSPTLAGDKLFVGCDNGATVVFELGGTYAEVGRNTLEPFSSCPVFIGDRMYVRTWDHMYCIGAQ